MRNSLVLSAGGEEVRALEGGQARLSPSQLCLNVQQHQPFNQEKFEEGGMEEEHAIRSAPLVHLSLSTAIAHCFS